MSPAPVPTLRPYQEQAVNEILAHIDDSPICAIPTGGGKSVVAAELVRRFGRKTLALAHRRGLVTQLRGHLDRAGLDTALIMAGHFGNRSALCQVASIQTLVRRSKVPDVGLILYDECFVPGTLVTMGNCSKRPIESVRAGDCVLSFDEVARSFVVRRVTRTFRRSASSIVRVSAGRRRVYCTPEHPFFSGGGWTPARSCDGCSVVVCSTHNENPDAGDAAVYPMREDRHDPSGRLLARHRKARARLLRTGVQVRVQDRVVLGVHEEDEPPAERDPVRAHEGAQSDVHAWREGEGAHDPPGDGVEASRARRERTRSHREPEAPRVRSRLADGGSRQREAVTAGLPHALQDRHREQGPHGGDRGGRVLSQHVQGANFGREKGRLPAFARMVRASVHEPEDRVRLEWVRRGSPVHNLEVEGTHTYIANGFVVHNCHHAISDTNLKLLREYSGVPIVGFTATPCRLDGKPLGQVFHRIIEPTTALELCAEGFLIDPRVFCGSPPNLDDVKIVHGDFDQSASAAIMEAVQILGDVVANWKRIAAGKRTLAFAVNIAHSLKIVAAFTAAGVPAAHFDASTPEPERARLIAALAAGDILVLSNVGLVTEGWDLPVLEALIIARPTASLVMHLQMIGRVARPSPGKIEALILDHAGNHERLGRMTDPHEWSLTERRKPAREETVSSGATCPSCGLFCRPGENPCSNCGHARTPRQVVEVPTDLVEMKDAAPKRSPVPFEERRRRFDQWVQQAAERGWKEGFPFVRYRETFGVEPVTYRHEYGAPILVDGESQDAHYRRGVYSMLYRECMGKTKRDGSPFSLGWAAMRWKEAFGSWPPFAWKAEEERGARRPVQVPDSIPEDLFDSDVPG